jgi:hypothetical protein
LARRWSAGIVATSTIARDRKCLVSGARIENGQLFGLTSTDPVRLVMWFIGIIVVELAATAIPAREYERLIRSPLRLFVGY